MARLLLLGDHLGNGDENLDGEKAHAILIVLSKMLKEWYHFVNDGWGRHFPDKLG